MLGETYCADTINGFANHPDIHPSLGNEGTIDLSAGIVSPNVFLFGEHGGICWGWSAPNTFEGHVMLTKAGRGLWGVRAGREAIAMMAGRGAKHLWCRVHPERPEVGAYAAAIGMNDTGQTGLLDLGAGPVRWRLFDWSK